MRKILFFLLLLPALAALGHDVYMFTQNQDKGFRLSDLGWLWDKYHKESHDQWKNYVGLIDETVGETVDNIENTVTPETTPPQPPAPYQESVTVESAQGKDTVVTEQQPEQQTAAIQKENTPMQKWIGLLLKQKAVFVFGGLAAIVFILNALLGLIFKGKSGMDEMEYLKKNKGKGGSYKYNRK